MTNKDENETEVSRETSLTDGGTCWRCEGKGSEIVWETSDGSWLERSCWVCAGVGSLPSGLVNAARASAVAAHSDQVYNGAPYVIHLDAVYYVLVDAGFAGPILAAAYLHDVVEDTDTEQGAILKWFGWEVSNLVYAVTGVGKSRKERNACIAARLAEFPAARNLKVADRIANLEACNDRLAPMYLGEHAEFLATVEGADEGLLRRLRAAKARLEERQKKAAREGRGRG